MINNLLITIINMLLNNNSGSKNELVRYSGKVFVLNIVGLSITAEIALDGSLLDVADIDKDTLDATITIPLAVATYLLNQDKLEVLRQIKVTGDLAFAVKFLEILSKLNFNGIYAKISPLNGVILHQVERVLTVLRGYAHLVSGNMGSSISEYMQYETGEIINRHKLDNFCTSVDDLKIRTDLLAKRIEKLVGSKI